MALNEVGQRRTQPCRDSRHAPRIPQFRLTTHKDPIRGKTKEIMPEIVGTGHSWEPKDKASTR